MKSMYHVLLIDDDPISNFINVRLINSVSCIHEVSVTRNANEALEYLHSLHLENKSFPDLILFDINTPGIDELAILRQFKSLQFMSTMLHRIVILSSSSYYADKTKFQQFNIDDFILKPLNAHKLNSLLHKINQQHS